MEERVAAYRAENGLGADALVPVDAVTGSGSGLDPQISVRNARLQAPRVADARGLDVATVLDAIDEHTSTRPLGVLGDPGVNVLELNLALDRAVSLDRPDRAGPRRQDGVRTELEPGRHGRGT